MESDSTISINNTGRKFLEGEKVTVNGDERTVVYVGPEEYVLAKAEEVDTILSQVATKSKKEKKPRPLNNSETFQAEFLHTLFKKRNGTLVERYIMKCVASESIEAKNKFNLTDEQVEQLEVMSPKEKKEFLKQMKGV